jgi:hypothetical protein
MKPMRKTLITLMAVLTASIVSVPAFAQQSSPPQPAVNVQRLPLDMQRIQRAIQQSSSSPDTHQGLRFLYQVDVYGRAPALELFTDADDLANGPVPRSAPTHKDMLEQMTPQEFRSPPADLTTIFRWLADKASRK